MNIIGQPAHADASPAWGEVIRSANAWRGQTIHHLAQAEWWVTEALLVLAGVPVRGGEVRFGTLLGQRLEGLRQAVGAEGPFAREGVAASKALEAFRPFEPMRSALCHGASRISVDPQGRWVLVLRLIAIRNRVPEHSTIVYEQEDAEAKLQELQQCVQRLRATLDGLRKSVAI